MKNLFFLIAALFCFTGAFAHEPEEAPAQETAEVADTTPSAEPAETKEETAQTSPPAPCGCTKR
ncbi:MAG TPA: hypothetical protein VLG44_02360 [Chlamydiales bacterium]|nr:hypothetical protein [Chlamydiales bacterium]